jgi:FkbM family methyltransferase
MLSEGVLRARRRESAAFDQAAGKYAASIIIYGAGNLGRQVLKALREHGMEPIAFCDANAALWQTQVEGVSVWSPESAVRRFGKTAVFTVCIWHPVREGGVQSVLDYLRALGAERVVAFPVLFWKYPETLLPYYFWDLPSRLIENAASVREAAAALSDDASRDAFVRHVRFRVLSDFSCLPPPAKEPAYFPQDLFSLLPNECFVDCGAFDGDTIREFINQSGGRFRRILAFEPDPKTFQALRLEIEARPEVSSRTALFSSVLGTSRGKARFAASGLLVSAVCDEGGIELERTTLDDCLRHDSPTFIKMDIEGSEIPALQGGRKTIKESRPVLAVCVYHRPEDLWRIPLLIRDLQPDASLALRMYWMDGFDLVCYAIPPHRLANVKAIDAGSRVASG